MKIKAPCANVAALLAGLLCAQIIATIQVRCSNTLLYRSLEVLRDEGYLIVPNETVMVGLKGMGPSFVGGLFFTLTLGAGLACAGLACAWLWDRLCGSSHCRAGADIPSLVPGRCLREPGGMGRSSGRSISAWFLPQSF